MRVLIAEDDPISSRLLEATLEKWGYEVVRTGDGMEALSVLEREHAPEIAVLDWMMPQLDGPEVCRRLRGNDAGKRTYVILLTAKAQQEDLVEGLSAGADDYVAKPFGRAELSARLRVGVRTVQLRRQLDARVRDLEAAMLRLRQLQQVQKLESLGRLAAGVAHEINTPTQFIGDNLRFLADSWSELRPILETRGGEADLDYLLTEVPKAIEESLEGVGRVGGIVRAMREFSHPSGENKVPVDINRAVETTVTVSTNEWKYVAEVSTELDPNLPRIPALPGEINQVLLNLIVNAAQAIGETGRRGEIRVATRDCGAWVEIRIADDGPGIPEDKREKVFDPFFTTKDIGEGTGQGLAIAHSVVVQQHGGRIWFESETGKGTTFVVELPAAADRTLKEEHEETHSVC